MADYEGIVEDINDPLDLGRVRVRVIGLHTQDKVLIPTATLPWATIRNSSNNPATNGFGLSPVGLHVGSVVSVEFRDEPDNQQPVVTGSYAGVGDLPSSSISRMNQNNSVSYGSGWTEPSTNGSPNTLKNKIYKSDTGIIVEIDDTDGRLRIYQPSGSLEEFMPSGDRVSRTANNDYKIITGKRNVLIKADDNLEVNDNQNINIFGSKTERISGNDSKQVMGNVTDVITGIQNIQANLINLQSQTTTNIASSTANMLVAPSTSIISSNFNIASPTGNNLLQNISDLAQQVVNLATHIVAHTHPTGVVNTGVPNNNINFLQDETGAGAVKDKIDALR